MEEGACKLCGEPGQNGWCFGCKSYICDYHLNEPIGGHKPEDHDDREEE